MRVSILIAIVLSAFSDNLFADHHETCTTEQFRAFGDRLVGRWKSDVKFIADWPGEDKGRGERVVGFAEYSWKADKNVIQGVENAGNGSGCWTVLRDPVLKKIKIVIGGTDGGLVEAEMWPKSENVYGFRITGGGLADGRENAGSGEWVFSENGKVLTMQGEITLAGEKLDPYKDVYTRLSPKADGK